MHLKSRLVLPKNLEEDIARGERLFGAAEI
jgi:hypothetical protein